LDDILIDIKLFFTRLIRQAAATIIERAWIAYRDKQMFKLLKHAVCAAVSFLQLIYR